MARPLRLTNPQLSSVSSPKTWHLLFDVDRSYDPDSASGEGKPWTPIITPPAAIHGNVTARLLHVDLFTSASPVPYDVYLSWGDNVQTVDTRTGNATSYMTTLFQSWNTRDVFGVPSAAYHRHIPEGNATLELEIYNTISASYENGYKGQKLTPETFFHKAMFVLEVTVLD